MKLIIIILAMFTLIKTLGQQVEFNGEPQLFAPGVVSDDNSEIKITFAKDEKLMLWGTVDKANGAGGFDIWQAAMTDTGWGEVKPVSFNSSFNDFDPSFSADGRFVYFFSNRPGGQGGDDIYVVEYDSFTCSFGSPINMGRKINTSGDEWGPAESTDGRKFIFCTDGIDGKGEHDIFICNKNPDSLSTPIAVNKLNSDKDDFDPVFLHDSETIIFSRKVSDDEVFLFVSYLTDQGYSTPIKIKDEINIPGEWNFGSSINPSEKSNFYYSTHIPKKTKGRLDIYRIQYKIICKEDNN